jgi:outer membrane protein OmpA-like peptidoglycan-associated protein
MKQGKGDFMDNTTKRLLGSLVIMTALLCTACASTPQPVAQLEHARAAVAAAERQPMAQEAAGVELKEAQDALTTADSAWQSRADSATVEHYAYLATRNAEIVEARVADARIREQIENSSATRNQILLTARSNEATMSKAQAQALQRELAALKAENTPRGNVLTLGDVLFDTDKARLKPGAMATIDRLAAFMKEYPQRRLMIEGHADARGTSEYNQSLSSQRAEAVAQALRDRGVAPSRIITRGLGEAYPLASNDTAAGQQENRRVEIVISSDDGTFASIRTG